jgi:hypothetical protein
MGFHPRRLDIGEDTIGGVLKLKRPEKLVKLGGLCSAALRLEDECDSLFTLLPRHKEPFTEHFVYIELPTPDETDAFYNEHAAPARTIEYSQSTCGNYRRGRLFFDRYIDDMEREATIAEMFANVILHIPHRIAVNKNPVYYQATELPCDIADQTRIFADTLLYPDDLLHEVLEQGKLPVETVAELLGGDEPRLLERAQALRIKPCRRQSARQIVTSEFVL